MNKNKWTKEEEDLCKKLLLEGKSYKEISNIINRTIESITLKNLRDFHIPRHDKNYNIDLIGKKFGRWIVLEKRKKGKWLCQCSCQNKTIREVEGSKLKKGLSTNCGCLALEKLKQKKGQRVKNKYIEKENYIIGYTTKGEEFYFDKEDYELVSKYCWNITRGYVVSYTYDKMIFMHRLIMNPPDNKDIDHINGNKNDNRKNNLRIVNKSQNQMNRKKHKNNSSGITGVRFDKKTNKWKAYIGYYNKLIHLGYFTNFEDAVAIRKEAEIKYFGEFRYKEGEDKLDI